MSHETDQPGDREIHKRHRPVPLYEPRDCPVFRSEIDKYYDLAVTEARRGNEEAAKAAALRHRALSREYDRWRVTHGPQAFIEFVKAVRPDLIIGAHHRLLAHWFHKVARRECLKLMIFMPPGHSKSLFASILLPAWLYGLNPAGRILAASHTHDLVEDFGREVRDIIASPEFRRLFPATILRQDVRAAGKWSLTRGGRYQAVGVGSAVAGRRADMLGVIDDPISEQDAYSETCRDRVNDWYPGGFRTRLMRKTPQILMMTRWGVADLAGHLLRQEDERAASPWKIKDEDRWRVVSIPAELDAEAVAMLNRFTEIGMPKFKPGDPPFPQLWPKEELTQIKAGFPPAVWSSLYMQRPTVEGGGILKREWWRPWPNNLPMPEISYLLHVWDTAYEDREDKDFNACTVWGVFDDPFVRGKHQSIILLGRFNRRLGFPGLREKAYALYRKWDDGPNGPVDQVLIEPKASGKSLIQELQRRGVPVMPWAAERGSKGRELSKIARAHAASVVLWSGSVYYPDGRRWADEVITQGTEFPNGEHDDLVDTCTAAWLWLRRNWNVRVRGDPDPPEPLETDTDELIAKRKKALA